MIQFYMEETEDMLQKAEECIIRLEIEYSDIDVNELFRIAHTIKGSSYMVGYEDIGKLMHKIEDMLDYARNGSILFDQSIVSLCFEGIDIVKKMIQCKKDKGSHEIMESLIDAALRINEMVEVFIRINKKEKGIIVTKEPEIGVISSRLSKQSKGKNTYYITFFFEEDIPMVSPVLLMILNSVEDIGTLVFSSIGDDYFSGNSSEHDLKTFDIIISTNTEEVELYTYFALFYIERINIVNLSRSKLEENDYSFIDNENILYISIVKVFMMLYKIIFKLELKINSEDIDSMRSLHSQAIHALDKMKNKDAIAKFTIDFNDLYSQIIIIVVQEVEVDEKLREHIQTRMVKLMERAYNFTKGKYIFSIFKAEGEIFISRLKNFIGMLNKSSTLILLIDLSQLTILHENEVKDLIQIKKQIESQEIEIGIIADGPDSRRIVNIFDSIKQVEEFAVFKSYFGAVLGILNSDDSFQTINKRVKDAQYE
jgi:two-component system chemotaxis sensor kinase CheA